MRSACCLVIVALALAGCGGVAKPSAGVEVPTRPGGNVADPPPRAAEPPASAAEQQRLELNRVAGELAELQNAVAKLMVASRQQEDQLTFLRRRLEELESQSAGRQPAAVPRGFAPSPGPSAPPPAAPLSGASLVPSATTSPAAELYQTGTTQLKTRNFDAAMLTFYDLIVTYPTDPLRESAQFLVADIYFNQKDYRGALAEFEALVDAVPRGERVPDALVKIGQCQKSLGDTGRAKRTWERIVKDYPASVAARQARALLRN